MRLLTFVLCTFLIGCGSLARADITPASSVDEVLDALDTQGKGLKSFVADVKLSDADTATGDESTRSGKVWYQSEPSRIRASFDKKEARGRTMEDKIDYVLAEGRLLQRTYSNKTQITRVVLKPGEKMNPLKLGEGPFPLPIGQKKEDVHAAFDVKKIEPKKDDPAQTIHLELAPKPNTRFARQFKTIDVWVDLKDHMPKRIQTLDVNESTARTTDLANIQLNSALKDSDFLLPKIDVNDWQLVEEAMQ